MQDTEEEISPETKLNKKDFQKLVVKMIEKENQIKRETIPKNFKEKFDYHFSLFKLQREICLIIELSEIGNIYFDHSLIQTITCALLAKEFGFNEKLVELLKESKSFIASLKNEVDQFKKFQENLKTEQFSSKLMIIYNKPIFLTDQNKGYNFQTFVNQCLEFIQNLFDQIDENIIIQNLQRFPNIFKLNLEE